VDALIPHLQVLEALDITVSLAPPEPAVEYDDAVAASPGASTGRDR